MNHKALRLLTAAAATAVAGTSLLLSAPSATAANAPYADCPGWALCLYQDGGGAGSKVILTPPPTGSPSQMVYLIGKHFLNGQAADNQTSSWLNNSQCGIEFYDDPNGDLHPSLIDSAPSWNWGLKHDYSYGTPQAYLNDRVSSLRFYNC
ncbi:peptidase inhibitor family I36 protein [Streptomyces sp. NPDC005908]|nr:MULTISPECIES: peptidase inhibitor family I36 protein [Streptomyces]